MKKALSDVSKILNIVLSPSRRKTNRPKNYETHCFCYPRSGCFRPRRMRQGIQILRSFRPDVQERQGLQEVVKRSALSPTPRHRPQTDFQNQAPARSLVFLLPTQVAEPPLLHPLPSYPDFRKKFRCFSEISCPNRSITWSRSSHTLRFSPIPLLEIK